MNIFCAKLRVTISQLLLSSAKTAAFGPRAPISPRFIFPSFYMFNDWVMGILSYCLFLYPFVIPAASFLFGWSIFWSRVFWIWSAIIDLFAPPRLIWLLHDFWVLSVFEVNLEWCMLIHKDCCMSICVCICLAGFMLIMMFYSLSLCLF